MTSLRIVTERPSPRPFVPRPPRCCDVHTRDMQAPSSCHGANVECMRHQENGSRSSRSPPCALSRLLPPAWPARHAAQHARTSRRAGCSVRGCSVPAAAPPVSARPTASHRQCILYDLHAVEVRCSRDAAAQHEPPRAGLTRPLCGISLPGAVYTRLGVAEGPRPPPPDRPGCWGGAA